MKQYILLILSIILMSICSVLNICLIVEGNYLMILGLGLSLATIILDVSEIVKLRKRCR
jgi:hypothetical protein